MRRRTALILLLVLSACGSSDLPIEEASDPTSGLESAIPTTTTTSTTTTLPPTTTTHTHKPRVTVPKPSRGVQPSRTPAPQETAPEPVSGDVRRVSSTAYCLTSRTANGERGYVGSVAMNGVPFGSKWRVVETGKVYTVNDRIGHSSQFDIWMPSCDACLQYGRRSITIERIA